MYYKYIPLRESQTVTRYHLVRIGGEYFCGFSHQIGEKQMFVSNQYYKRTRVKGKYVEGRQHAGA